MSLCLLFPSLRFIQKYSGDIGVFVIALGIFLFVYLAVFSVDRIPYSRHLKWVYLLVFALIVLIFFVVYPIANSGAYGGIGSDRDDAINIGVSRLINGKYPYYATTYLGNPLGSISFMQVSNYTYP
jgi:energy-coupling factor transporter transmembrane protein EcfT